MWWNMIAGFAQGWIHGQATRALTEANNSIAKQNAESSNKVRVASNAAMAAKNTVARFVQSLNNNRTLDSGGDAIEQNMVNFRRGADNMDKQSFGQQIRSAEQQGMAAAAQAFSGVDGSVVDMVNGSTALRDSMVRQNTQDSKDMASYDVARRAGNIMTQMVGGLDNSLILDNLDYTKDVAKQEAIIGNFGYAMRGMAEHMGGGGAINSGYDKADANYTKETSSGSLAFRERSSSAYDLADYGHDTKGGNVFGFKDTSDYSSGNPYSIGGGGGSSSKFGDRKEDSYWNTSSSYYSF